MLPLVLRSYGPLVFALCACAPPALVVTTTDAPKADTDAPPLARIAIDGRDGALDLGRARAWLSLGDGRVLLVDEDRALVVVDGAVRTRLLDAVVGAPVAFSSDAVLAARAAGPGESDLWRVPLDGGRPRAIAAHRGADGQPFVLDDGRVLFVSDRTGVASVFIVDVARDPQRTKQLTNTGERPGALSRSFQPPPLRWLDQQGAHVRYHDGHETRVLVVDVDVDGAASGVR